MGSITLVASIVAGPLAGAVMLVFGPWTGYLLGLSFIILCWLLSLLLPDTLRLAAARKPAQSGVNSEAEASSANVRQPKDISSPINFLFTKTRKGLVEAGSFLSHHRYVVILSMCFLFEVLAGLAGLLLLQYVTKKFEWSWGKVNRFSPPQTFYLLII